MPSLLAKSVDAPPAAVGLLIGAYLERLRQAKNLGLAQAAGRAGMTGNRLNRIEAGLPPLRDDELKHLLDVYRSVCPPPVRDGTQKLLKSADACSWDGCRDAEPGWVARLSSCEQAADSLRICSHVVPGIFQTSAYALAYQRALPQRPLRASRIAATPRALPVSHGKHITVYLDQRVLTLAHGGPATMAQQLTHLLNVAQRGDAEILIVPYEAAVLGPSAPLSMLELHGQALLIEESFAAVYSTGDDAARCCRQYLEPAADGAHTAARSLDLLDAAQRAFQRESTR
ncbi:Scr1 family TA system antitoxin-like transcriptional regulator [Streptomyces sp. H39-C1]|uniref:Scr1 family TA system antitoxin-like transcriptional regulator n=1 Tax=Streptomyces sp. H39-C1 TaxID=3004355 RepID=UPI0022AF37E3|nr:Scr1 family TA system antitoxin-like transcriptional regulator [Streptomyces sp. H39-C1]MCZ4102549.1 Scr1 family TA system antitoxin-like transcriptional regulator [Streptomyces sp. H39-C1]